MLDSAKFKLEAIHQIGIVVKDLDAAVERYWKDFGIGPWAIITLGPGVKDLTYYGEPCSYALKIALAQAGPLQIELVQPLYGPTPHQDFLDQKGEGIQHVGIYVPDIEQVVNAMHHMGYKEISTAYGFGPDGDGAGAYFDTQNALGIVVEYIQSPKNPGNPERFYPENM